MLLTVSASNDATWQDSSAQLVGVVADKPLPIKPLRGDGSKSLSLASFKFSSVSGCLIARLLRHNRSLKTLDLSNNGIGTGRFGPPDEDFPNVGRAVIELSTALRYNLCLEQLKLASCALTDERVRLLARELKVSTLSSRFYPQLSPSATASFEYSA